AVTHDMSERLSWYLFSEISQKRPAYVQAQTNMKEICLKCHTKGRIDAFYVAAETQLAQTNSIVSEAKAIMDELHKSGKLTAKPFDEPLEYTYFNMWHYAGRTSKHGAFMGGADFVQWHGNYELVSQLTEIRKAAGEMGWKPAPVTTPAMAPANPPATH
ncbi:MAG: hypothetical protein ABI837_03910, partial [Acidobacteriota bacterium]